MGRQPQENKNNIIDWACDFFLTKMNLFIWYVVAAVVLYGIFEMTSVFDSVSDTLTGGVTAKSMGDAGGDDRGAWKPVRGEFITWIMNKETIACIFFPLMGILIYLYVLNHMNEGNERKERKPEKRIT